MDQYLRRGELTSLSITRRIEIDNTWICGKSVAKHAQNTRAHSIIPSFTCIFAFSSQT